MPPTPEFESLEAFIETHEQLDPDLKNELQKAVWSVSASGGPEAAAAGMMSPDAISLLGAGKLIAERLQLPPAQIAPAARRLFGALTRKQPWS